MRDHAEKIIAIGHRAIGAHALGVQVFVGLFAFVGQQPREDSRGFGTLDLERLVRSLAVGMQNRVLDVALRCHDDRRRRITVIEQLISLVARRAQDGVRLHPRAFQDLVGRVLDEIAARGDCAIALVAFVTQAVVGLFTLWGEISGVDGALTLAPIGQHAWESHGSWARRAELSGWAP
jgi:hypothetical protein